MTRDPRKQARSSEHSHSTTNPTRITYPLTYPERAYLWRCAKQRAEGKRHTAFNPSNPRSSTFTNYVGIIGEWVFHRTTGGSFYHNPHSYHGDGGHVDSTLPDTPHLGELAGKTAQIKTSYSIGVPSLILPPQHPTKHADIFVLAWMLDDTSAAILGYATWEQVQQRTTQSGATLPPESLHPASMLADPKTTTTYPHGGLAPLTPCWDPPATLDDIKSFAYDERLAHKWNT